MSFSLTVRLPEPLRRGSDRIAVTEPVRDLSELSAVLERTIPGFAADDSLYNYAVNGEVVLHGEAARPLASGDEVELLISFSGG